MLGMPIPRRALRCLAAVLTTGTALAGISTTAAAQTGSAGAPAGGSQVTCTSRQPGLASRLAQDIAAALRGRQGTPALALYDRPTATSCTFRPDARFDSASVVKVTVLAALLRTSMEEHRSLTPREAALSTAMITKSDNDATSALWRQIGHKGIQRFLTLAGMQDTVLGPKGYWGRTQITAGDQLKLLRVLTSDNSVLDRNARAYALGLMNQVVPTQRWGVPAGASDTVTTHLKNGWLPRATNGWRVHSIGVFTGGGHDYGMVVLSHGNRSIDDGIVTIERVARVINRELPRQTAS
ncbi:serine hydrolase [Streptomyces sp. NPDC002133]|uniref:serine hydrolase n=1 Tax=Streptomyces sp. NPDC002133 TaxID=3154409 RepID=UPI003326645C